jgi:hypothetical protein
VDSGPEIPIVVKPRVVVCDETSDTNPTEVAALEEPLIGVR